MKSWLTLLFITATLGGASAQIGNEDPFRADSLPLPGDSLGGIVADTSDVYWLYTDNPYQEFALGDTLLGSYFTQYDPIRKGDVPRGHLGNLGTPAVPLFYQAPFRQGFHLGLDAFDYLRKPLDSLLFYRTGQAYTLAAFSQGINQEHTALEVDFGREFGPGLGLSLYYNRLNNQGSFIHQRAELSTFAFGIWLKPPKKGYQAFLRYGTNANELEYNGGVAEDLDGLESPVAVSVRTESAQSRYATREAGLVQHIRIFVTGTETRKRAGQLDLVHDLRYQENTYKYFDDSPESDSSFYGIFQTDQRGIRNFIHHQSVRNALKLHFFTSLPPDSTGIRQQRLRWEAGIVHTWHWWEQEPASDNLHDLFATFRLKWPIGKKGLLEGNAHLGLLGNAGDYRLDGRWYLPVGNWGGLEAFAVNQRYAPGLLENRLYVTRQLFWKNDFQSTIHTTVGGALSAFKGNVKVRGSYHLVNYLTWFDTLGIARQTGLPVNVLQLDAWLRLRLGPLYFENRIGLQQGAGDFLRLPGLYGAHSLYLQGKIFKKVMLTRLGVDLRLTGDYTPYAFHPLTGQFYLQNTPAETWQPLLDAVLAVKVRTFRFHFRLENILPALTQQYYFLVNDHPIPYMTWRAGISWQFVD